MQPENITNCNLCKREITFILLITTIVGFILYYYLTKSLLLGMKCVSRQQDLQMFVFTINKYEYFQPLEVVGCGTLSR